jgi:antitoxin component YwqK of YwqJK toxin-antitoxin module
VWKLWNEEGIQILERQYAGGLFRGQFTEWYPGGIIKTRGFYANNQKDGLWETFSESGSPISQTPWKSGVKHGIDKEWYGTCQVLEENYENGLKQGPAIYHGWYSEKKECYLSGQGDYINDLKEGVWKTWKRYTNEGWYEIAREGQWFRNIETKAVEKRMVLVNAENGTIPVTMEEDSYRYTRKHGFSLAFRVNSDGSGNFIGTYLYQKTMYQYGIQHGPYYEYRSDGELSAIGQYANNLPCGIWQIGIGTSSFNPSYDYGVACQPLAINPEDPTIVPFIEGIITDAANVGIPNVTMTFDNAVEPVSTDASGYYIQFVPKGWSGTITPVNPDYKFEPPSRTYANVVLYQNNQHYTATKLKKGFTVWADKNNSGVCDPGEGIEGATVFVNAVAIGKTDPSIAWLLLILTCIVMYAVLSPRRRAGLRWGRGQTGFPMSKAGAYACVSVFLLMTAGAFGLAPFWSIFASVPLLACAGACDSYLHSRKTGRHGSRSPDDPISKPAARKR